MSVAAPENTFWDISLPLSATGDFMFAHIIGHQVKPTRMSAVHTDTFDGPNANELDADVAAAVAVLGRHD